MQFTLTAAALIAVASASSLERRTEYEFNSSCVADKPLAKVTNRCSYPVYLWSIDKQLGCPSGSGMKLETGQFYNENLQTTASGGVSIKMSKYETCGDKDHTQLEYKLDFEGDAPGDYLDMSFVNCLGMDCPGRSDGYYFKVGNDGNKLHVSAVDNEHCPIHEVYNAADAAKVAYILPDDRQTKFCANDASMELYLCGGEAPGSDNSPPAEVVSSTAQASPVAASSTSEAAPIEETSTSTPAAAPSSEAHVEAMAAAVTPAPEAPAVVNVKTHVVYETVYVDAKKRHAHGRRHRDYHA